MNSTTKRLRRLFLSIPLKETLFSQRSFYQGHTTTCLHLEHIGQTFLAGYHAALDTSDPDALAAQLITIEHELRGFAFEGARPQR
jgi:hypothetical protein